LNTYLGPEMLREGREEGRKDMKDSEKARSWTTKCVLTTSICRQQHRLSCCKYTQAHYVLVIRETLAHWSWDESEKTRFSGDLASFLVYARKFIWLHAFLFPYVYMWNAPIRTWTTSELRPSLLTKVHEACAHSWNKMVSRMTQRRFHMSWRYMNVRSRTRKYPYKGVFLDSRENSWTCTFKDADWRDGPGRTWKCSVCALDYKSVLSKHIQMLTPGILTFLHLNMPSYLVSSPFLKRRTWMTMSLQHGLSSERSKNYSSSIQKNTLLCTASTCHTNWTRVFQVVLHSVVVYYKSKVRATESIYKWVSV
jgi:hypothetical protein